VNENVACCLIFCLNASKSECKKAIFARPEQGYIRFRMPCNTRLCDVRWNPSRKRIFKNCRSHLPNPFFFSSFEVVFDLEIFISFQENNAQRARATFKLTSADTPFFYDFHYLAQSFQKREVWASGGSCLYNNVAKYWNVPRAESNTFQITFVFVFRLTSAIRGCSRRTTFQSSTVSSRTKYRGSRRTLCVSSTTHVS